jgi:peptide/nickel transport system substrate-binding protein
MKRRSLLIGLILMASVLASCATPTPEIVEVTREVEKEVTIKETTVVEQEVTKIVEQVVTATPPPTSVPRTEKYGGTLRWAFQGDPPTLDVQWTTTGVTAWIGFHIYESLFTWDEELSPIPDLAESYEVSEDGLTYTVNLRQGVLFHNGKEMTSEDVVASLQRWVGLSGAGEALFERVENLSAPDDYTLVFEMNSVYPLFEGALAIASQGPVIYPKEVVEEAGDGEIQQYIGTGPYKFEEWQRDRLIRLVRFEDYLPHGETPNGYGGKKMAYLDEIIVYVVPDESTRLAGLLAGDYDRADGLPSDEYERMTDDPRVKVIYGEFGGVAENIFNLQSAITSDQKLRQAMLAATDADPILKARVGHDERMLVTPALADGRWYTEVGWELFDQNDPEKAKQLLAESNYNGETIRWLTTKEFPGFYELAVVHSQQMEAIGIDVELLVSDWATVVERRSNPDQWEVLSSGWGMKTDPMLSPQFLGTFVGWWQTPDSEALREQMLSTVDFEERFSLWEDMQRLWYEEVPCINYGKARDWHVVRPYVMDDNLNQITRALWNVWLAE